MELGNETMLIKKINELGCIKFGEFTLKSGIVSPYYLDLRPLICNLKSARLICGMLKTKMLSLMDGCTNICGVPYSGIPLATIFGSLYNLDLLILRKERKEHGTGKLVEGVPSGYPMGYTILMEDVISTGGSVLNSIKQLRKEGVGVKVVCVVVDREMGGVQKLKSLGYTVITLFKITELLKGMYQNDYFNFDHFKALMEHCLKQRAPVKSILADKASILPYEAREVKSDLAKKLLEQMVKKSSNLCVSADIVDPDQILKLADMIGPYIVVLKMHLDTLTSFSREFAMELHRLSEKHGFMLFEDRKFADIGSTVKRQFETEIYKYKEWIDIVNVHGVTGDGPIKAIDGCAVLIVAQLSNSGNLIDDKYTKQCVQLAKENDNVIGFISQKPVGGEHFLHFTPGVRMGVDDDGADQRYKSVRRAVLDGADIIIVGRGITEATDVVDTAKSYMKEGWEAYLERSTA